MSKLSEYSKFDHLDSDSDEDDDPQGKQQEENQHPQTASMASGDAVIRRNDKNQRFIYEFKGKSIYEWEQTLLDVTLYIPSPPNVKRSSQIVCNILPSKIQVGQRGADRFYLDENTFGTVDTAESTWCWEDNVIVVYLQKANKGIVWEAALMGREKQFQQEAATGARLNPLQLQEVQKDLMLERWQEENPGMDFRGATFNGSVPDPRTFMGGVKYE